MLCAYLVDNKAILLVTALYTRPLYANGRWTCITLRAFLPQAPPTLLVSSFPLPQCPRFTPATIALDTDNSYATGRKVNVNHTAARGYKRIRTLPSSTGSSACFSYCTLAAIVVTTMVTSSTADRSMGKPFVEFRCQPWAVEPPICRAAAPPLVLKLSGHRGWNCCGNGSRRRRSAH